LRIERALRLIKADAQIGYVFRQSREGVDYQTKGNYYGQYVHIYAILRVRLYTMIREYVATK